MHLLEQLRTEEPVPLDQLDPSIPSDLVAIIQRALRKDPAERFGDLEQVGSALEAARRELVEEARRAAARARDQRAELLQLRTALEERIGTTGADVTIPMVEEPYRLAAIEAVGRDFASRIEGLQALMAQADVWAPVFQRAMELLDAGQFSDAVDEFETIVADMPEHARALDGLTRAREKAQAERHRQLAAKLTKDARSALESREYTLCLEILKQAAELQGSADTVTEITSLRMAAEAGVETQEALRRARQRADAARSQAAQARAAQAGIDSRHAPMLWNEAETARAEAESAFAQESYSEAAKIFDAASAAYHRFETAAREAQRREEEATEHARDQVAQARQRSQAEAAPEYARELWEAAEAKSAEAHAAFTARETERAIEFFSDALALYARAEDAARQNRTRERENAEKARAQAAQSRERAGAAGASRYAREQWDSAEAAFVEAEHTFAREAYAQARQSFAAASDTYRRLEEKTREARHRERDAAERARENMAQTRQATQTDSSSLYVPELWDNAKTQSIQAEAALARGEYAEALAGFEAAAGAYRHAEEMATEARRRERDAAEHARENATMARERALSAGAPQYARGPWEAAEAQLVAAQTAFSAELLSRAAELFSDALTLYLRAEKSAAEALQRERQRAQEARERAAEAQRAAAAAESERQASAVWNAATAKFGEGETALVNEQYRQAATAFSQARTLYQRAENETREAQLQQRGQAEQARQTMVTRRQAALATEAAEHAAQNWQDAEASAEVGAAAFAQEAYADARRAFDQAVVLYRHGEGVAREVVRAIDAARTDAEKARDATAQARRAAAEAQASRYAADKWNAAETAEAEASAAFGQGEHVAARALFTEARRQYAAAGHAAGIALEADTRRADAMVSDARQLLASGDIAACLRRVNEVLTFRPDHTEALRLRQEAEGDVETTRLTREAIVQGDLQAAQKARETSGLARRAAADVRAERYAPDEWRASAGAAADATAAFDRHDYTNARALFANAERLYAHAAQAASTAQATEAAERLRHEAQGRQRTLDDDATNIDQLHNDQSIEIGQRKSGEQRASLPEQTDEGLTIIAPMPVRDAPSAGQSTEAPPITDDVRSTPSADVRPSPFHRQDQPDRAPTLTPSDGPAVRRGRTMLVAVGTMAAVLLLMAVAWKYWPTPDVWPPSELQELVRKVTTAREEASLAGAERSQPFILAQGKVRAADAAFGRRDATTARERYREALAAYESAASEVKAGKEAALTAQSRADDARKKAETAEAQTRAAPLWKKAEAAQRTGSNALEARLFDNARKSFVEAEQAYKDAEKTAGSGRLSEERQKAIAAQSESKVARLEAERARARGLAGDTFALGQQKESEAESVLDADPAAAQLKFQDALLLYKKAGQEAGARRVTLVRSRAEQARGRMATARREAEQAAASQRARDLFDWGARKEREAGEKFEKKEYAGAEPLFTRARADYEIAALEARRPEERIAPPQLAAEQAQRRAVTYREKASRAGADRLFEVAFGLAYARERSAETAMKLKAFKNARDEYGEAGELYLDVGLRAADRNEADNARATMIAAKQGLSHKSPEYQDAHAEETDGVAAYKNEDYREAAERFRTAHTLYARAATKKTAAGSSPASPGSR